MPEPGPSAQVIPFPPRPRTRSQEDGQERLRRALLDLDGAIAGQRAAVAAWRKALGELGSVVSVLGENLHRYRDSLDTLGDRLTGLRAHAIKLEQAADAALVAHPD